MAKLASRLSKPPHALRNGRVVAASLLALAITSCQANVVAGTCPAGTVPDDLQVAVNLAWTTDKPGTARVEYGSGGATDQTFTVDAQATTNHDAVLVGLPSDTDVSWTTTTTVDGAEESCSGTAHTGTPPADLPQLTVVTDDLPDDTPGRYLMGSTTGLHKILYILDRQGNYVWYKQLSDSSEVIQFEPSVTSDAWMYGDFNIDHKVDTGKAVYLDRLGQKLDSVRMKEGHHFFAQLDDGTIAYCATDIRDWTDPSNGSTKSVVGDVLRETSPDGTNRDLFSTWDYMQVEKGSYWSGNFYPGHYDWTHCNAVKYMADSDSYLVSFGGVALMVEVDRQTGEPLAWYNGARDATYGGYTVEGSDGFSEQHDGHFLDNGDLLLVSTSSETEAIEYAVDDSQQTLTRVWSFGGDLGVVSPILGEARRLSNGDTFVVFGLMGQMREVDPDGNVVWEADWDPGVWTGNVALVDSLESTAVQ